MSNTIRHFPAKIDPSLFSDHPVDLQTLVQAMDDIVERPQHYTKDEIVALIAYASGVVARLARLRHVLADELVKAKLEEAEPEGRA